MSGNTPSTQSPKTLELLQVLHQDGVIDEFRHDCCEVVAWVGRRGRRALIQRAESYGFHWTGASLRHADPREQLISVVLRQTPLEVAKYLAYTLRRCMAPDGLEVRPELLTGEHRSCLLDEQRFPLTGSALSRYVCSLMYHRFCVELDAGTAAFDEVDEILAVLINDVDVPQYLLEDAVPLFGAEISMYAKLLPVASALAGRDHPCTPSATQ